MESLFFLIPCNDSDGGNFRLKTGVNFACKPVFGWKFTSEESQMLLVRLNPDKKMPPSEQLQFLNDCARNKEETGCLKINRRILVTLVVS